MIHQHQSPRKQQELPCLSKGTLAYTAQKDKMKEVDIAVEIDGLRKQKYEPGPGKYMEHHTSGRQHTAPMVINGVEARRAG